MKVKAQVSPKCLKGSKGADFPEKLNKPLPHEPIVTKHGYDAFADHNLNTLLQNRGVKTLIFSGIDSAVCVDTTLRHAFHLGYYVVFAQDICTSPEPDRHQFAIKLIESQYGWVTTTKEIMQIWGKPC